MFCSLQENNDLLDVLAFLVRENNENSEWSPLDPIMAEL